MHRWALVLLITCWSGLAFAQPVPAVEAAVRAGIDAARARHDAGQLQVVAELTELAREHSRRMAQARQLSHSDPLDGRSFRRRVQDAELTFRRVAENVAMNSGAADPAATAVAGWLDSAGHRANLLDPGFTHTGIGVWQHGETYYFTQIFLTGP